MVAPDPPGPDFAAIDAGGVALTAPTLAANIVVVDAVTPAQSGDGSPVYSTLNASCAQ